MITDQIVRSKRIKDPLFSSIKLYLASLAEKMVAAQGLNKFPEAAERYYNVTNEDVQIEPPTLFANGKLIACFLSRKTGLFYADAELVRVELKDIFRDLFIEVIETTESKLKSDITNNVISIGLFYLTDKQKHVIVLNENNHSLDSAWKVLGSIYWDELELTLNEQQDPVTKLSGAVKFKAPNMLEVTLGVYYKEHFK